MDTDYQQSRIYAAPARRLPSARPDSVQHRPDEQRRWEFALLQSGVFFAPYVAFRHPGVYITLSDVLFAGAFLLRLYTRRLASPFANITWLWLLGLLMLTGGLFIGSIFKGDMVRCLVLVAQYSFAYLVVPLILLRRPEEEGMRLIKCGIWGMAVMCAIGTAFYMVGGDRWALFTGDRRFTGFLDNPDAMAVLTVMALPLTFFLLLSRQMKPITGILCIALLVTGIILTGSNTGLYSMAAATLIFFTGRRNFRTLITMACLGGAVLMVGQGYLPTALQQRLLPAMSTSFPSGGARSDDRQALNREALSMADENVVIGLGADQYRMESRYGQPVQNLYLLLLNEGGGLSLLGYLLILGVPIVAGVLAHRLPDGKLALLTTVTIVVVFANAIMGVPHVYGRFWFLFILLAVSPTLISFGSTLPVASSQTRARARSVLPPLRA